MCDILNRDRHAHLLVCFAEASTDSGQGDSQSDVIVFDTPASGEAGAAGGDVAVETSDAEEGDSESLTSFEDVAHLNADLLLYKASSAKNVAVMLQALAQGAKPNWHNDEEEGRTALIQTIQAVRLHSLYMYIIMQVRVCCHFSKCVSLLRRGR